MDDAPAAIIHRLDAVTLRQGDGPIVISIKPVGLPSANRFSARISSAADPAAKWQACTAMVPTLCQYSALNGSQTLRFEHVEVAGELQVRYGDSDSQAAIMRIPIEPLPASATLQAIGRAFGASATNASAPPADALRAELTTGTPPRVVRSAPKGALRPSPFERVRVVCAQMPLFATRAGAAVSVGGKSLVAQLDQTFTADRTLLPGPAHTTYRALYMGAVIYAPAQCLRAE